MNGRKGYNYCGILALSLAAIIIGQAAIAAGSWLTDAAAKGSSKEILLKNAQGTGPGFHLNVSGIDCGFRPEVNGFSFENYGGDREVVDLTPEGVRAMFGEEVCSGDDSCTLIPGARRWMEEANEAMGGGHCEGMAVLSLLIYYDLIDPEDFGGIKAIDLDISDEMLQREIAYWWATQITSPASMYRVYGPNRALTVLSTALKEGKNASETWTMGVFKNDGHGGHAITPFAVVDQGNGIYGILVYDNNYPGQTRTVEIDTNNDTFAYEASPNPQAESDLYVGQNLEISGTRGRLEQQECTFCYGENDTDVGTENAALSAKGSYVSVWHDGHADMLIRDDRGRRVGWLPNGTFINEIPGAKVHGFLKQKGDKSEYLYLLPSGINYSASLEGTGLQNDERQGVTTIGPGYYAEAEGFAVSERSPATVGFSSHGDRYDVSYRCHGPLSTPPRLRAGIQEKYGPDYEFLLKENHTAKGYKSNDSENTAVMGIERSSGRMRINSVGGEADSLYDLMVARLSEKGPEIFSHSNIHLEDAEAMVVDYSGWEGDGYAISIGIDENDDGTVDEPLDLEDEGGTYEEIAWEYDQEDDQGYDQEDDQEDDQETDGDGGDGEGQVSDEDAEDDLALDDAFYDAGGDFGDDE